MSIRATVEVNPQQLAELNAMLADISGGTNLAIKRAVKRTMTGVKTLVAQEIGKKTTLKSATIKDAIATQVIDTSGKLTISGRKIPLSLFSCNPTIALSQRASGAGVSVKIYKDRAAVRYRHAFWAVMPNGHTGLFERKITGGRVVGRLGIDELIGPSVPTFYEMTPELSNRVETTAAERLQRELDAQMNYILQRYNQR